MIDHISIHVSDLEKSAVFYEKALGAIGYKRLVGDFGDTVGFAISGPQDKSGSVWLSQEGPEDPLTHIHVAFAVPDIESVKKFYDAAMVAGGRDNGAPGKCPEYGPEYYGGFVFDPDGNNIEATTYVKEVSNK